MKLTGDIAATEKTSLRLALFQELAMTLDDDAAFCIYLQDKAFSL